MAKTMEPQQAARTRTGVLLGVTVYGMWGLIPLYFKAVAQVAPLELLAHRAWWSFVFLGLLLAALRRWPEVARHFQRPRTALMLAASAVLIAGNWLTFIYAVQSRQVMQSSLGYFINPLLSMLLGVIFLGERMRPGQIVSILLALAGVSIMTFRVGAFPAIALLLATTFAAYGLLRKVTPVDSLLGLAAETMLLAPLALAYLGWLGATHGGTVVGASTWALVLSGGVITTIPLLVFGGAAKRLRLATLGVLQYLTPSLQFLLAVAVFDEPFSRAQLVSFACIWSAVAVYTAEALLSRRPAPLEVLEPD